MDDREKKRVKQNVIESYQSGKTRSEIAREFEIPETTVRRWCETREANRSSTQIDLAIQKASRQEGSVASISREYGVPESSLRRWLKNPTRRGHSDGIKAIAIERVRNGEPKKKVAKSLKIPESTLRGWYKVANVSSASSTDSFTAFEPPQTTNVGATTCNSIGTTTPPETSLIYPQIIQIHHSNSDESPGTAKVQTISTANLTKLQQQSPLQSNNEPIRVECLPQAGEQETIITPQQMSTQIQERFQLEPNQSINVQTSLDARIKLLLDAPIYCESTKLDTVPQPLENPMQQKQMNVSSVQTTGAKTGQTNLIQLTGAPDSHSKYAGVSNHTSLSATTEPAALPIFEQTQPVNNNSVQTPKNESQGKASTPGPQAVSMVKTQEKQRKEGTNDFENTSRDRDYVQSPAYSDISEDSVPGLMTHKNPGAPPVMSQAKFPGNYYPHNYMPPCYPFKNDLNYGPVLTNSDTVAQPIITSPTATMIQSNQGGIKTIWTQQGTNVKGNIIATLPETSQTNLIQLTSIQNQCDFKDILDDELIRSNREELIRWSPNSVVKKFSQGRHDITRVITGDGEVTFYMKKRNKENKENKKNKKNKKNKNMK